MAGFGCPPRPSKSLIPIDRENVQPVHSASTPQCPRSTMLSCPTLHRREWHAEDQVFLGAAEEDVDRDLRWCGEREKAPVVSVPPVEGPDPQVVGQRRIGGTRRYVENRSTPPRRTQIQGHGKRTVVGDVQPIAVVGTPVDQLDVSARTALPSPARWVASGSVGRRAVALERGEGRPGGGDPCGVAEAGLGRGPCPAFAGSRSRARPGARS